MALLLSLILSAGSRKTAWLDPNVGFSSWSAHKAKTTKQGLPVNLAIGIHGDDEDDLIGISSEEAFSEQVGFEYLLVQTGVLKDAETSIDKYIDPEDDRHVSARLLIKPTIILTAKQVVDGCRVFRKWTGITKANFRGRKTEGNRFGTNDLGALIKFYFPRAYAKAKGNKWPMSSHYCRKLYATSAFHIYSGQIQRLSGKFVDKSVFTAAILGHGSTSLATSLSYANVKVSFGFSKETLSTPPEHEMRLIRGELQFLRSEVAELKKLLSSTSAAAVATLETGEVGLVNQNGVVHTFTKHSRTKWTDDRHRDSIIMGYVEQLKAKKVKASFSNLEALGFGRGTYAAYRSGKGRQYQPIAAPPAIIRDRALQGDGPKATAELPPGSKVIAITNDRASENAKRQAIKRNIEVFGSENVIESVADCEGGTIIPNKKIKTTKGTVLTRDVCEENR